MKSFSLPSDVLQKYAYKDNVRNLNAEFQRMGGKVASKSLKGGIKIQLSHPDDEFLDDFRIKLLDALGILPEEEAEALGKAGKKAAKKEPEPIDIPQEDRGDLTPIKDLIGAALKEGAIDDGQIIKYAYQQELDAQTIDRLRSELNTHRCRNPEFCPHKRKRIKFEDAMKSCLTAKERCRYLSSDYTEFFDQWLENVHAMFSEFDDRIVDVQGKISHYRFMARGEGQTHFRILLFDTMVNDVSRSEGGKEGKETRKIWIKVTEPVFDELNVGDTFGLGDIIKVRGKLQWNSHYGEYQVNQVNMLDMVEAQDGMRIQKIPGPMIGPNYKPEGEDAAAGGAAAEKEEKEEEKEGKEEKKGGEKKGEEEKEEKEGKEEKDAKKEKKGGEKKGEEGKEEKEGKEGKDAKKEKKGGEKKGKEEKEEKGKKKVGKEKKKGKKGDGEDTPEEPAEGKDEKKGKKPGDYTQGVSFFD